MRTLVELYKLVLQDLENSDLKERKFIRNIIENLDITEEEKIVLNKDFIRNKPSEKQYANFFNHPAFLGSLSWWKALPTNGVYDYKPANEQRVLFIKHLINTK